MWNIKENVDLHFSGQLTRDENVSKVFEKIGLNREISFKNEWKKNYRFPINRLTMILKFKFLVPPGRHG